MAAGASCKVERPSSQQNINDSGLPSGVSLLNFLYDTYSPVDVTSIFPLPCECSHKCSCLHSCWNLGWPNNSPWPHCNIYFEVTSQPLLSCSYHLQNCHAQSLSQDSHLSSSPFCPSSCPSLHFHLFTILLLSEVLRNINDWLPNKAME